MILEEAIAILNADLLGLKQEDYANAWLKVAFTEEDLSESNYDQDTMLDLLSSVLSKQTGGTKSVIRSVLHSPNAAKAMAARNYVDLKWVLERHLMQWDKPINNAGLALVIMAAGGESPKFGDALAYIMETGEDVDPEIREAVINEFNQAVAESDNLTLNESGQIEVTG